LTKSKLVNDGGECKEHDPAHFHAQHRDQHATFDFDGQLRTGTIRSKRALRRIREWAILHRTELEGNWGNMKAERQQGPNP
jgi:hypothetical protein